VPQLIWSPESLLDIQRLYRFLVVKSPDAAKRAVQAIRTEVQILANNPEVGRPSTDMEPEFREWLIDFGDSGYVAFYRYDGHSAVVLAVRHQKEVGY
jgi:plasmid stabilization system protein ParE